MANIWAFWSMCSHWYVKLMNLYHYFQPVMRWLNVMMMIWWCVRTSSKMHWINPKRSECCFIILCIISLRWKIRLHSDKHILYEKKHRMRWTSVHPEIFFSPFPKLSSAETRKNLYHRCTLKSISTIFFMSAHLYVHHALRL